MFTFQTTEAQKIQVIAKNTALLTNSNLVSTSRPNGSLSHFSTLALVTNDQFRFILSGFIGGPQMADLYYTIEYDRQTQQATCTFTKHRGSPQADFNFLIQEIKTLENVSKKRVKQIGKKIKGMKTALGFSLFPGTHGPKSKINFARAINQNVLTSDFETFCRNHRFQLRFKQ